MVASRTAEHHAPTDAGRALVVAVVAYVVVVPALGATLPVEIFAGKSVFVADVVFAAVACAFVWCGADRRRPFHRGITALAALLVVTLVGLALAAGARRPALLYVARVTYSMAVLVLLAHVRFTERERRWIVGAWVGTAVALSSASALGYAVELLLGLPPNTFADASSASLGPSMPRIAGVMHANAFAVYLVPAAAMMAHWCAGSASRARWGRAGILLVLVVGALTVSRGLAGVVLTVALLAFQPHGLAWLGRWRHVLAAVALALVAFAGATLVWAILPFERRADAAFGVAINARPPVYRVLHQAAVRMVSANPVAGVGLGEFRTRVDEYSTSGERAQTWPPFDRPMQWDTHSTWLGYAAEGGLLGLAAWTAVYAGLLGTLWRARGPGPLSLPRAAAIALVALMVDGLHVDFTHVKFVWAFLGLALGATERA